MNRTVSPNRRGGVPKGRSWTHEACWAYLEYLHQPPERPSAQRVLRRTLAIIQAHSRCNATRAEAARLLAILEHRTASEAKAECLRSGPLFRQDETAPGQAVTP